MNQSPALTQAIQETLPRQSLRQVLCDIITARYTQNFTINQLLNSNNELKKQAGEVLHSLYTNMETSPENEFDFTSLTASDALRYLLIPPSSPNREKIKAFKNKVQFWKQQKKVDEVMKDRVLETPYTKPDFSPAILPPLQQLCELNTTEVTNTTHWSLPDYTESTQNISHEFLNKAHTLDYLEFIATLNDQDFDSFLSNNDSSIQNIISTLRNACNVRDTFTFDITQFRAFLQTINFTPPQQNQNESDEDFNIRCNQAKRTAYEKKLTAFLTRFVKADTLTDEEIIPYRHQTTDTPHKLDALGDIEHTMDTCCNLANHKSVAYSFFDKLCSPSQLPSPDTSETEDEAYSTEEMAYMGEIRAVWTHISNREITVEQLNQSIDTYLEFKRKPTFSHFCTFIKSLPVNDMQYNLLQYAAAQHIYNIPENSKTQESTSFSEQVVGIIGIFVVSGLMALPITYGINKVKPNLLSDNITTTSLKTTTEAVQKASQSFTVPAQYQAKLQEILSGSDLEFAVELEKLLGEKASITLSPDKTGFIIQGGSDTSRYPDVVKAIAQKLNITNAQIQAAQLQASINSPTSRSVHELTPNGYVETWMETTGSLVLLLSSSLLLYNARKKKRTP